VISVCAVVITVTATGCGNDEPGGDAMRFCGEIEVNQEALFAPELESAADVDAVIELYREIGQLAPLAVEPDWDQLIVNYETAGDVIAGDEDSLQAATVEAYQSEKSAAAVQQWLIDNCALDIGPVATIVPHDGQAPATTPTTEAG
jgi:hypothetical protein